MSYIYLYNVLSMNFLEKKPQQVDRLFILLIFQQHHDKQQ